MAATTVTDVVAALDSVGTTLATAELTDAERLEVIDALRRTLYRLQTPLERAWDMSMAEPHLYAAIKTTMDLGLWKAWGAAGAAGHGAEKSLGELVGLCNKACHPNLLRGSDPVQSIYSWSVRRDIDADMTSIRARSADAPSGRSSRRGGDGP